jgi:hypothetical protein
MKTKLDASNSALAFVMTFNKYMAFFQRNYALPNNAFGYQHVEECITADTYIMKAVFSETDGNLIKAIRNKSKLLKEMADICDLWFYWPVEQGGLGLKHHILVNSISLGHTEFVHEDAFELALAQDKATWEENEERKRIARENGSIFERDVPQSFEVYTSRRLTDFRNWTQTYQSFRLTPTQSLPISLRSDYSNALTTIFGSAEELKNLVYARLLVSYYHSQIEEVLGGFGWIDSNLIPQLLIQNLKAVAVKWE